MLEKRFKLSPFQRLIYRTFYLKGKQYKTFKKSGKLDFYWNIITWYHFFKYHTKLNVSLHWYAFPDEADIVLKDIHKRTVSSISINYKKVEFVMIHTTLTAYKQINGVIYEIVQ